MRLGFEYEVYSRGMKFAAMTLAHFARESGCLAGFSDRQYKFWCKVSTDGKF